MNPSLSFRSTDPLHPEHKLLVVRGSIVSLLLLLWPYHAFMWDIFSGCSPVRHRPRSHFCTFVPAPSVDFFFLPHLRVSGLLLIVGACLLAIGYETPPIDTFGIRDRHSFDVNSLT